jgi:YHS domain-containing protein
MSHRAGNTSATVVDSVCGMTLRPESAAGMARLDGQAFYFCSRGATRPFDADPAKFRGRTAPAPNGRSCCGGSSSALPLTSGDSRSHGSR